MNAISINFSEFIQIQNNQTITTSEFIAQAFGKQHKNVLAKIEEIAKEIKADFFELNFKPKAKQVKTGFGCRETKSYELTKDGFMLLVMGFTGKAAMQIKIAYIEAFNLMAEQIKQLSGSPKTTADDRTGLRQAVSALVSKKHIDYSDAYSLVHHRFAVEHIDELTHEQIPQAVEYVHRLILDGEVLDKPKPPALPQLNDELVLSIGRLLLHAQDMRLFVNRYLPAFECLGITNHGALWSYVHDTEPTFERVREFFLQQTPYQNHHLFSDDAIWVRRRVMATIKV
ncbi:Rha family transcriptional regulator [Wielerella bovis]|uniref:Rha family transcriptional regulator n=1 Tax=Wielerella bovis TaxID=2917790 RepID=UPI002019B115|nr:Rha family transcriptional regulator [Wielerella bovis]MCG7657113.1 Rha family transcriptional regulator [Wielerella bovis]MCG7659336.1 Rha family transcriptional regulator [Wielerella bovis]